MKKLLFLLLSLTLLLSACATVDSQPAEVIEPAAAESAQAQPTEAPFTPTLFKIVKPDGTIFEVTLEAVKTLPLATLTVEGKVEEGPYLKDVLALAGITEFSEVSLTGSSNPATLTFEQVDKNTILDFNNHGTMKLSTTYISKPNWTKDVAEIMVK